MIFQRTTAITGLLGAVGGVAAVAAFAAGGVLGGSRGTITTPWFHTQLGAPRGVAVDRNGTLYIADTANNRVLKVIGGRAKTIAGNGQPSNTGTSGPAPKAGVANPMWLAVDSKGNIYVSSGNHVYKVSPSGRIANVAGTDINPGTDAPGPATSRQLDGPTGVVVDGKGNVYIADTNNQLVRKVAPNGLMTTIAGGGTARGDGDPATLAKLYYPSGLAVDGKGNLFIVDTGAHIVRKVSPDGTITTIAGTGTCGFSGDEGKATKAKLCNPIGIAIDRLGNLYIADEYNARVRKVSSRGTITTFAGSGKPTHVVPPPFPPPGTNGDGGPATAAKLLLPFGVAVDARGDVYIADSGHGVIREVRP